MQTVFTINYMIEIPTFFANFEISLLYKHTHHKLQKYLVNYLLYR